MVNKCVLSGINSYNTNKAVNGTVLNVYVALGIIILMAMVIQYINFKFLISL